MRKSKWMTISTLLVGVVSMSCGPIPEELDGVFRLPEDGIFLLRCAGPDPAVTALQYELVELTGDNVGRVRITGKIKNIGQTAFSSSSGQQSLQLYEGGTLVATEDFINMLIDGEVTVTYEREWSVSDEFKPDQYVLLISYDPDIYIDDNLLNDDCNQDNNRRERDAGEIDDLFD